MTRDEGGREDLGQGMRAVHGYGRRGQGKPLADCLTSGMQVVPTARSTWMRQLWETVGSICSLCQWLVVTDGHWAGNVSECLMASMRFS